MPRGRRVYTTEEMIQKITSDIELKESEIKELKEKLKQAEDKKKLEENEKLINVMKNSGLSVDDVISIINSSSKKSK